MTLIRWCPSRTLKGRLETTNKNGLANQLLLIGRLKFLLENINVPTSVQSKHTERDAIVWIRIPGRIKLNLIIRGTVSGPPDKARRIFTNGCGASSIYRKQFSRIFTITLVRPYPRGECQGWKEHLIEVAVWLIHTPSQGDCWFESNLLLFWEL